jgi:hypothetical protein
VINEIKREVQGESPEGLLPRLSANAREMKTEWEGPGLKVESVEFREGKAAAKDGLMFQKHTQESFGIEEHGNFSYLKMMLRHGMARGIAAADINRDGWTDFAISSDSGFAVFLNDGGSRFTQLRIETAKFNKDVVTAISLVDLNNDGWSDLWVSTLESGNFVIYNKEGKFPETEIEAVPNLSPGAITDSPAFGDIDRDGVLEIFVGNVSLPAKADSKNPYSIVRNALLTRKNDGSYSAKTLSGLGGETLTTLFSDINGDNKLDLVVGNDLRPADVFYFGDGQGGLRQVTNDDGVVPQTTSFTMSIASADLDNDLIPELMFGNISRRKDTSLQGHSERLPAAKYCSEISDKEMRGECEKLYSFRDSANRAMGRLELWKCSEFSGEEFNTCVAFVVSARAFSRHGSKALCKMPKGWSIYEKTCLEQFAKKDKPSESELANSIKQVRDVNVLLKRNSDGTFKDVASEYKIEKSGWTWNSKFADLDSDGFQDLYTANGFIRRLGTEKNHFYRNIGGNSFEDMTDESGLGSWLNTLAYTYVDYDNDGDLDVITVPIAGPLTIFENQTKKRNSIMIELADKKGNYYGIGSKIVIRYGEGKHQMREIQSSGGYQSFDAPITHFGLGDTEEIDSIEIQWSTGEKTLLDSGFRAGMQYRITRSD